MCGRRCVLQKLIQPSMEAEYVLSGDRHHFLIHKAQLEAKYLFTPYGQRAGQISSHIVYVYTASTLSYDAIRYDTRCHFNVRSKADTSQLNLPHGTDD